MGDRKRVCCKCEKEIPVADPSWYDLDGYWCRACLDAKDNIVKLPAAELKGLRAAREDAAKFRAALARLVSPDNPADMDNRELITAMMTATYCLGSSPAEVEAALHALALLRDTIPVPAPGAGEAKHNG